MAVMTLRRHRSLYSAKPCYRLVFNGDERADDYLFVDEDGKVQTALPAPGRSWLRLYGVPIEDVRREIRRLNKLWTPEELARPTYLRIPNDRACWRVKSLLSGGRLGFRVRMPWCDTRERQGPMGGGFICVTQAEYVRIRLSNVIGVTRTSPEGLATKQGGGV